LNNILDDIDPLPELPGSTKADEVSTLMQLDTEEPTTIEILHDLEVFCGKPGLVARRVQTINVKKHNRLKHENK